MLISLEFISGVMLGFEYINKADVSDEVGWYLVVDLVILRLVFDYKPPTTS
jgi:hypothetical protein